MSTHDFYRSLGLDPSTPSPQIAADLDRRLAAPGLDSTRYDELMTARHILGDPAKRATYDQALSNPATSLSTSDLYRLARSTTGQPQTAPAFGQQESWAVAPPAPAPAGTPQTFGERAAGLWAKTQEIYRAHPGPTIGISAVAVAALVAGIAGGAAFSGGGGNGSSGKTGLGFGKSQSTVTGAAEHHEFELVESIVLPDAGAIRGLEETMDGQVIAAVAPERGDMRVIKFNPHDGAIEELASAAATENYAGKAGHMPQIAKGFGITQFHPTPDSGDPTRQRSTAAIALNVGGLDAGQIIDGQYEPEDFSWVPYDNGVGVGLCAMPSNEKLSIGAEGTPMEERGQKAGTGFVYRSAGDGQLSTVMLEDLVDHQSPTNVRIVVDDDRTKVREEFPGSAADMVVDPEKVGDSIADYDFKKMLEGEPDYDLDLRGVTLADTAVVGGLGELDCLSVQQVAKFAEGGIADEDPEGTRVMAVVDSEMNDAFAEGLVAGGMERDFNLAEFTAPVDMVMIEPSTGVVTDTFSVSGLRDSAQISGIAAFVDDPTQMWVTIEGDDHLHRVQLKKG